MSLDKMNIRVLVVARWPLGGIRTYMRYMFSHLPSSCRLSVLAASTQEDHALFRDCTACNAELKLVRSSDTRDFAVAIFKELQISNYDIILSQGFISSVAVYLANVCFRIPHVLTIHGIVESQYVTGKFGSLKRRALGWILSRITVLYAVSNDILEHLYCQYPRLKTDGPHAVVIPNGIELKVLDTVPAQPLTLRKALSIDQATFIFGFLGRFMPQKGFDLLIEAVLSLQQQNDGKPFAVAAIGSGDYLREYQAVIRKKGLNRFFHFLPFQPMVHHLYPQIDVVVMPSRWEASGLLAMEALCMGAPLIASDCIGLRETVAETPAKVFQSENVVALTDLMLDSICNNPSEIFRDFIPEARARYDVNLSSVKLLHLITQILGR
ncbi:glycosyltransferase family 4 protein [Desulfobulbus sp.]|uniref:glycosyltransferase family 4 protein n=1 Tax=Desulfobulbus sp. TaxID=895 RepID=UPI0027BAA9D8|nr:glycosyltransferase family 4 protein [Desulfobulbus sp.]